MAYGTPAAAAVSFAASQSARHGQGSHDFDAASVTDSTSAAFNRASVDVTEGNVFERSSRAATCVVNTTVSLDDTEVLKDAVAFQAPARLHPKGRIGQKGLHRRLLRFGLRLPGLQQQRRPLWDRLPACRDDGESGISSIAICLVLINVSLDSSNSRGGVCFQGVETTR